MGVPKTTAKKHPRKKTGDHVKNWAEDDHALRQRGSLTGWIRDGAVEAWGDDGPRKRGGQQGYAELAIETGATVRAVDPLPWRQTEGFMGAVVKLLGVERAVPDHTTLSRRASGFSVVLPVRQPGESLSVVVDATGLTVSGEGEGTVRQHGVSKRRTWRKRPVAVDDATGELVAEPLPDNRVDDGPEGGIVGGAGGAGASRLCGRWRR